MSTPGIVVRPLREITGTSHFNEVSIDDVAIPASNMIGRPGQGWAIANSSLAHARSGVGAAVVKLKLALQSLIDLARRTRVEGRPALDSDRVRDRIGMFTAQVDALSALTRANISRWTGGTERMHDAAMAKLMFSELNLAIASYGIELAGEDGILVAGDAHARDQGRWQNEWLYARASMIAGSSEIMRNVIAERGLGLSR
jgi:alkylation response protein AidB-like acyl-CoA dehydrogenase